MTEFDKPEGRDPNASFTLTPAAIDALKRGSTIEAIKIIRDATGVGLAEAKSIVDEIAKNVPAEGRPGANISAANIAAALSSHQARPGLAPGEVARGGGTGKWLALIALVVLAVLVGWYFRAR